MSSKSRLDRISRKLANAFDEREVHILIPVGFSRLEDGKMYYTHCYSCGDPNNSYKIDKPELIEDESTIGSCKEPGHNCKSKSKK